MGSRGRAAAAVVVAAVATLVLPLLPDARAELAPGGTFVDDDGTVHEGAIEALVAAGIIEGCGTDPASYCPGQPITRGQVAVLLARALGLPPATRDWFDDDRGHVFEDAINRLREAGITLGCDDANGDFCPDAPLSRAQVAALLVRAFGLPPSLVDWFDDDDGAELEDAIDSAREAGITDGCDPADPTRYCPSDAVTRGQFASLLAAALGLDLLVPPSRGATTSTSTTRRPPASTSSTSSTSTSSTSTSLGIPNLGPAPTSSTTPPAPCVTGTFNATTGAEPCTPAPPGFFVDTIGAHQATPCPTGRFQPAAGQDLCLPAPLGTYVDSIAAIAPTPCPALTTTPTTGSDEASDCVGLVTPTLVFDNSQEPTTMSNFGFLTGTGLRPGTRVTSCGDQIVCALTAITVASDGTIPPTSGGIFPALPCKTGLYFIATTAAGPPIQSNTASYPPGTPGCPPI